MKKNSLQDLLQIGFEDRIIIPESIFEKRTMKSAVAFLEHPVQVLKFGDKHQQELVRCVNYKSRQCVGCNGYEFACSMYEDKYLELKQYNLELQKKLMT